MERVYTRSIEKRQSIDIVSEASVPIQVKQSKKWTPLCRYGSIAIGYNGRNAIRYSCPRVLIPFIMDCIEFHAQKFLTKKFQKFYAIIEVTSQDQQEHQLFEFWAAICQSRGDELADMIQTAGVDQANEIVYAQRFIAQSDQTYQTFTATVQDYNSSSANRPHAIFTTEWLRELAKTRVRAAIQDAKSPEPV